MPGGTRALVHRDRPRRSRRCWLGAYAAAAVLIAALPLLRRSQAARFSPSPVVTPGARRRVRRRCPGSRSPSPSGSPRCWSWPPSEWSGIGLQPGHHAVHSRRAWQAWVTLRLLDEARTWLYPIYASTLTPLWLRALGARIGRSVEASTVLLIPRLTTVNDEAFLADDTLIGSYELGGGWLRVERVKVGKRAFVGNSGMLAAGRKVPKQSLVAVLSAAPRRTKAEGRARRGWAAPRPSCGARPPRRRRQPHLRPVRAGCAPAAPRSS